MSRQAQTKRIILICPNFRNKQKSVGRCTRGERSLYN